MSKLVWTLLAAALVSGCTGSDDARTAARRAGSGAGGGGGAGGSAGGGANASPIDAPGISISNQSIVETEPHLVTRPNGDIAVAWIGQAAGSPPRIGYTFSKDQGRTWQPVEQAQVGPTIANSDPVMAVDAAGTIYLAWLAFEQSGSLPTAMRIYVAKAAPDATTFGPPVEASEPTTGYYDKPWITVGADGTILLTYSGDDGAAEQAVMATSKDAVTWAHTTLSGNDSKSLIYVCSSPSGRLWVTYLSGAFSLEVVARFSDDHGATWSDPTTISDAAETTAYDDPTCVADDSGVWISYALGTGTGSSSAFETEPAIVVAHALAADPKSIERAHTQDPSAGSLFLHPMLALHETGVDLAYYAAQSKGDPAGALRYAGSDDGATFRPSAVGHTPIFFDLSRMTLTFLGDYLGVATTTDSIAMAYVDNTKKVSHVSFAGRPSP